MEGRWQVKSYFNSPGALTLRKRMMVLPPGGNWDPPGDSITPPLPATTRVEPIGRAAA